MKLSSLACSKLQRFPPEGLENIENFRRAFKHKGHTHTHCCYGHHREHCRSVHQRPSHCCSTRQFLITKFALPLDTSFFCLCNLKGHRRPIWLLVCTAFSPIVGDLNHNMSCGLSLVNFLLHQVNISIMAA